MKDKFGTPLKEGDIVFVSYMVYGGFAKSFLGRVIWLRSPQDGDARIVSHFHPALFIGDLIVHAFYEGDKNPFTMAKENPHVSIACETCVKISP